MKRKQKKEKEERKERRQKRRGSAEKQKMMKEKLDKQLNIINIYLKKNLVLKRFSRFRNVLILKKEIPGTFGNK